MSRFHFRYGLLTDLEAMALIYLEGTNQLDTRLNIEDKIKDLGLGSSKSLVVTHPIRTNEYYAYTKYQVKNGIISLNEFFSVAMPDKETAEMLYKNTYYELLKRNFKLQADQIKTNCVLGEKVFICKNTHALMTNTPSFSY